MTIDDCKAYFANLRCDQLVLVFVAWLYCKLPAINTTKTVTTTLFILCGQFYYLGQLSGDAPIMNITVPGQCPHTRALYLCHLWRIGGIVFQK